MKLTQEWIDLFGKTSEAFGIHMATFRDDLEIAGSPERSELRAVIEDADGALFIVESVFQKDLEKKREIAEALNRLQEAGLEKINRYRRGPENAWLAQIDSRYWLASPFVDGVELNRPDYAFEEWRAIPLADFLIRLKRVAGQARLSVKRDVFTIVGYIRKLRIEIRENDPDVYPAVLPFIKYLEDELFENHDDLPVAFCHGDYHPLNMIWSDTGIKTVIDWEFCGFKPESYDLANLTGCLGMENPDSLNGPLVVGLMERLMENDYLTQASLRRLVPMIVAIRFAWLAEWLRRSDTEMIRLEIQYLEILTGNADYLRKRWQTG